MSRRVLGGLIDRSGEWVKAVETGRLQTPRLGMLLRIARALGVRMQADDERREARRLLARVYQLADFYVAYQLRPSWCGWSPTGRCWRLARQMIRT